MSAVLPAVAQSTQQLPIGQTGRSRGARFARATDPIQNALARLTLTAEQQAKVKTICDQETTKIQALRGAIDPAHSALDAAAHSEKPDPTAVGNAYLKLLASEDAVRVEFAKYHDAVAAVLTAEQKVQFESELNSAREERGRWGGWQRGGAPKQD